MAETNGLLNRHTGLNLYRGFESPLLRIMNQTKPRIRGVFVFNEVKNKIVWNRKSKNKIFK